MDPATVQLAYDLSVRMANLRKRILLLGLDLGWVPSGSTSRAPGDVVNIADFDVVIANIDAPGIAGMLGKSQLARLVASGGALFVVGAPLGIGLDFLPGAPIVVRAEPVETVTPSSGPHAEPFQPVVSLVRRAEYSIQRPMPAPDDIAFQQAIGAVDTHPLVMGAWVPIAVGRQGDPVAFGLFPTFWRAESDTPTLGAIVWLGRPSESTPEDMADSLLANVLSRPRRSVLPIWLATCALPERTAALEAVSTAGQAVEAATASLGDANARAEDAARWEPLLYADGPELETVVAAALAELGGTTTAPVVEGIEDLDLITPSGVEFVVEVKGTSNSLKVANLRQVVDWWTRAIAGGANPGTRKLVVSNPLRLESMDSRASSDCFPHNCMAVAETLGVVVLSTRQIYEAIRQLQLGIPSAREDYWSSIEATGHGLVATAEFAPPPT